LNPENAGTGKVKGKVSYMYKVCITVNFIGSFQGSKPPIGDCGGKSINLGTTPHQTMERRHLQEIECQHFCQKHARPAMYL